ncbi:MAG: glycosyltransferase [Planctomycetota bacterium]
MAHPRSADNTDVPDLSVVIPMYNEQDRIGRTLDDALSWLREQPFSSEVVLVDDGSTDRTREVVAPLLTDAGANEKPVVRLVSYGQNRGKGAAVVEGLRAARSEQTLMMDADNAASVREVLKLFRAMGDGVGLVAGSREAPDADVEAIATRRLTGALFRTALGLLGLNLIRDTQCGFKLYSRAAVDTVVEHAREPGFVFDLEHLALTRMAGLSVVERGIRWRHVDGSKVSPIADGLKMLSRAAKLRTRLGSLHRQRSNDPRAIEIKATPDPAATSGLGRESTVTSQV